MNYYYEKNFYNIKDVRGAEIYLDNGEYINLYQSEIIDFEFEFYDKMIWFNNAVTPVAKKGFVKLDILKRKPARYNALNFINNKGYNKNKKEYIENLFFENPGIINIRFYNCNNWEKSVCGQFISRKEGKYIILSVVDIWPNSSSSSDVFSISMNTINKDMIDQINLDFENCEGFDIFRDEILEMQLNIDEKLEEDSSDYSRKLINGFIKIKLNPEITWRDCCLFYDVKKPNIKHIKKRLLYRKEKNFHNICHLYINYERGGFGTRKREKIEIDGIWKGEDCDDSFSEFISGYCVDLGNDVIGIYFKKDINVDEEI